MPLDCIREGDTRTLCHGALTVLASLLLKALSLGELSTLSLEVLRLPIPEHGLLSHGSTADEAMMTALALEAVVVSVLLLISSTSRNVRDATRRPTCVPVVPAPYPAPGPAVSNWF